MATDYNSPEFQSRYRSREPNALRIAKATGKHTRIFCDNCEGCIERNCDGSTARHHFIHVYREGSEESDRLLQSSRFPEYPDRDSGV